MKKKYVSPHSMVVTIATTQFLCNSIPTGGGYNGGKILSPRRRGQANWEDEEDDEDF